MKQANPSLTEEDDGKTVETHVGDALDLNLHENATTGYRWAFDGLDAKMIDAQEVGHVVPSGAVGSAGVTRWTLKAIAPGTSGVRLKLWRHWEGDSSIQKRFEVILVIHDAAMTDKAKSRRI